MDSIIQTFLGFSAGLKVLVVIFLLLAIVTTVVKFKLAFLEYKVCGGDYSKLEDIKHEMAHRRIEKGEDSG